MIKTIQKNPLLSLAIFTIALLLPNLTALEVGIMEARNFISAREMLTEGNWILTTLNGEARYEKPPLPTWITAVFGYLFGMTNVWALRLPGALMVTVMGMAIFKLSQKLNLSKNHSLYNGFIAVTSAYVVLIIFDAPWDIYAHTFMLWSIYFLIRWLQKDHTVWSGVLCVLFLGASILSKGPVSVYVLLLSFLGAYFVVYRKELRKKRILFMIVLLLCGLVIGFSWYAYVRIVDSETFVRITSKETSNWSSYNVRPFYYYWSFFIQSGVWTLPAFVSLFYPYLKTKVRNLKAYQFTLLWTFLAVVLLSVIPEKKSRYLMPVLLPLAINCGFYVQYLVREFKTIGDWKEKMPVYVHFGVIGLVFLCVAPLLFFTSILGVMPWYVFVMLGVVFIIGFLLLKALLSNKSIKHAFFYTMLGILVLGFAIAPISNTAKNHKAPRSFGVLENPTNLPIYAYRMTMPEMIWEYGKTLPDIDSVYVNGRSIASQFLVLECTTCGHNLERDFRNFNLTLKDSINLNKVEKEHKNYRYRKTARVYLATRK